MRQVIALLCICALGAFVPGANCQSTLPPPPRDLAVLATLQESVAALGGAAGIQDCTATGTISSATTDGNETGSFTWQWANGEFNFTTVFPDYTESLVTGHGTPADTINGSTRKLYAHVTEAVFPAHLLAPVLQQVISNNSYSVTLVGPAVVNGTAVTQVKVSLATDPITNSVTQQTWSISTETGLPIHVDYVVPAFDNADSLGEAAVDLSAYRSFSGILVPTQLAFYAFGEPQVVANVSSVTFNSGIPASTFDAPGGGQ